MKSGKNLGIAYSVKKKAKGGKTTETMTSNRRDQKGVHTSMSKSDAGTSTAGGHIGGHGYGNNVETSKRIHKEKLQEQRQMPKPNLPMAEGGSIRSGKTRHQNEKGVHSESFSYDKPGKSDSGVYIRSHGSASDKSKKLLKAEHQDIMEQQSKIKPNLQGLAEGGMIDLDGGSEESMDHDSSMADAIMARRDRLHEEIDSGAHDLDSAVKMAEGGEVDIDDNAEEQPNEFYDLNEDAALKENFDSDMDDVSQPEDSNEDGHMIDKDDHDMVDKIRSGMKKRQR